MAKKQSQSKVKEPELQTNQQPEGGNVMSNEAVPEKRQSKLSKDFTTIPGSLTVDPNDYPGEYPTAENPTGVGIKGHLPAFAAGHKLGDSAAGRTGQDALDAITKVHEGMLLGDWNVRAPASPKVSLADVAAKFAGLSDDEKATAKALMAQLGINLPGM